MFNSLFKSLEFGPLKTEEIRPSFQGMAFRGTNGRYCTYDMENNRLTDVSEFLLDMDSVFLMPTAIDALKTGDVVRHQGVFHVVKNVEIVKSEDEGVTKKVVTVNPIAGTEVVILPVRSPFGFDFITKAVDFLSEGLGQTADKDNPFGNMGQILMMQAVMGKGGRSGDNPLTSLMMMSMMTNGSKDSPFSGLFGGGQMNPLMMMFLMGDQGS